MNKYVIVELVKKEFILSHGNKILAKRLEIFKTRLKSKRMKEQYPVYFYTYENKINRELQQGLLIIL